MNALGYVRVSTDEQVLQGASLDDQRARIKAYCVAKGWILVDVLADEGWSGSDPDRPGLRCLVGRCSGKPQPLIGAVVVTRIDRFTRRIVDVVALQQLEAHGTSFVSIEESIDTTTPHGRMMLHVLLAFAQCERETIGQRVRATLGHLKSSGKRYSNLPPYGWQVEGDDLAVEPREQACLAWVGARTAQGWGSGRITAWMNAQGYTARGGKPFSRSLVSVLMRRARAKSNTPCQDSSCLVESSSGRI